MKFKTSVNDFLEAVSLVSPAIESSPMSPEYGCVQLSVRGSKLFVRGTDLVSFIEAAVKIETKEEQKVSTLVPFKPLSAYLSAAKGDIVVDITEKEVVLKSKNETAKYKIYSGDNITAWPKWADITDIKQGQDIVDGVRYVSSCISLSAITPVLFTAHLKGHRGEVIAEAADGFRFAFYKIGQTKQTFDILIPNRAIKVIETLKEVKTTGISDKYIAFKTEQCTYFFRLASHGEFPAVSEMVPEKFAAVISLDVDEFKQSVNRALAFSESDYKRLSLSVKPSEKKVEVSASSEDLGDYLRTVGIKAGKGADINIMLDIKHLNDYLTRCEDDAFIMGFTSSDGPVVFTEKSQKDRKTVCFPLVQQGGSDAE